MSITSTVTITSDIAYLIVNSEDTNNIQRTNRQLGYSIEYNHGTGNPDGSGITNSQVNLYVKSTGTISGNSQLILDFRNYPKYNLGSSYYLNFGELKGLVIENQATGTGESLYIMATGSNAFTNIFNGGSGNLPVHPSGTYLYTDIYGTTVSDTNRYLQISNPTSTGINYEIIAVGVDPTGLLEAEI